MPHDRGQRTPAGRIRALSSAVMPPGVPSARQGARHVIAHQQRLPCSRGGCDGHRCSAAPMGLLAQLNRRYRIHSHPHCAPLFGSKIAPAAGCGRPVSRLRRPLVHKPGPQVCPPWRCCSHQADGSSSIIGSSITVSQSSLAPADAHHHSSCTHSQPPAAGSSSAAIRSGILAGPPLPYRGLPWVDKRNDAPAV